MRHDTKKGFGSGWGRYYHFPERATHYRTLSAAKKAARAEANKRGRDIQIFKTDMNPRSGGVTLVGAPVVPTTARNPSKRKAKKKKSVTKRISAALSTFLKKQNPAMKRARGVRVQKLKDGSIKFKPEF